MIYIDNRVGSKELLPIVQRLGYPCELTHLEYGDAMFEGHGPQGTIAIGIERKTVQDMLQCIEDARYSAHQLPGMKMMYSKSYLCLEGFTTPGDGNGYDGKLMYGFRNGSSWGPFKLRGTGRTPLYSKLYRYMMSVALAGVIVTPSSGVFHTAYNICEMFEYYKKPWSGHRSLVEVQKLAIPVMTGKASLVRKWASDIDDIGVVLGQAAERKFRTPFALANSEEMDWLTLEGGGIGPATARRIIRDIRGWKK